eukprot:3338757-Pleurochrysis_carterae.AAC.1
MTPMTILLPFSTIRTTRCRLSSPPSPTSRTYPLPEAKSKSAMARFQSVCVWGSSCAVVANYWLSLPSAVSLPRQ